MVRNLRRNSKGTDNNGVAGQAGVRGSKQASWASVG